MTELSEQQAGDVAAERLQPPGGFTLSVGQPDFSLPGERPAPRIQSREGDFFR